MKSPDPYNDGQAARYYDLSHAQFTRDIRFYLDLLAGRSQKILELGCGSGRLLIPLAEDGHSCWGVDRAPAMLALAAQKVAKLPKAAGQRITLVTSDMTDFTIPHSFEAIIIPHNTLMHLAPHDLNRTLIRVWDHLAAEGRIIIDLTNPFSLLDLEDQPDPLLESTWIDPEDNLEVRQYSSFLLHEEESRLQLTWWFVKENSAPLKMTADYNIRLPHELELALAKHSFKVINFWGDFDHRPFKESSKRLILIAARSQA